MPTVPVYNIEGAAVGEMALSDAVFAAPLNQVLMHQVVVGYLANRRQGTVGVKTRGKVSGGGRKQYRQKGTGHSRQGSNRAPHWKGGGTVFGPMARDYRHVLPRALRRRALCGALTSRLAAGRLRILDALPLDRPRTKALIEVLDRLALGDRRTLIVTGEADRNVYLSGRNVPGLAVAPAVDINALQVLRARNVVLTREAVTRVEGVLGA